MTTEEFSNEFDTILQSYSVQNELGQQNPIAFDEYEKSVFLTKAQEQIIITLYNGKNSSNESLEKTEELRRYLSNLIKTEIRTKLTDNLPNAVSQHSQFFSLPDDLWFITYESAKVTSEDKCLNGKELMIIPVTQDDYFRTSRNPFRQSNDRKALRLDIKDNTVEIISKYDISQYLVRYLSKPEPIVLIDFEEGLSINNVSTKKECKLNPALHRLILDEAIRLALVSKGIVNNNKTK